MTINLNFILTVLFPTVIYTRFFFYYYFHEDRKEPIIPFWLCVERGEEDLKKLLDVLEGGACVVFVFVWADKFINSSRICCLLNLWSNFNFNHYFNFNFNYYFNHNYYLNFNHNFDNNFKLLLILIFSIMSWGNWNYF